MKTKSQNNNNNPGIANEPFRYFIKIREEFSFVVPWVIQHNPEDDLESRKRRIEKLNKEHQSVRRTF